jgi:hypothetical protein
MPLELATMVPKKLWLVIMLCFLLFNTIKYIVYICKASHPVAFFEGMDNLVDKSSHRLTNDVTHKC